MGQASFFFERPKLWRRLLSEPLVHFLAAGALLFLIGGDRGGEGRYVIRLDAAEEARIAANFVRQYGGDPSEDQMRELVEKRIREEVLYREGLALGLDRDDEIIRRRVVQKYEFLRQDRSAAPEPTDGELREWFTARRERYRPEDRASFTHVYFSPDRGGREAAARRAGEVLAALRGTDRERAPDRGDAFPDRFDFGGLTRSEVGRVFGESPLADRVFDVPEGVWAGPFSSGLGEHLVRVTGRLSPPLPFYRDVEAQVREDWTAEWRRKENERSLAELQGRYAVVEP